MIRNLPENEHRRASAWLTVSLSFGGWNSVEERNYISKFCAVHQTTLNVSDRSVESGFTVQGFPAAAGRFWQVLELIFSDCEMPPLFSGSGLNSSHSLSVSSYDDDVVSSLGCSDFPVTLRQIQASPIRRTDVSGNRRAKDCYFTLSQPAVTPRKVILVTIVRLSLWMSKEILRQLGMSHDALASSCPTWPDLCCRRVFL